MKGPTSFQASYFDRHMPFTYTHTPNGKWIKKFKNVSAFLFFEKKNISEFSSFQFPGHLGKVSGAGAGPSGLGARVQGVLGNQTPTAVRHNKKKGFGKNLYKSAAKF